LSETDVSNSVHQPVNLKRSMRRIGVLLLTLSYITPAASVFIIAPGVVQQAGTGAAISFIAAAFISLCVAFAYAELGSAFPLTGGEYAVVARVLGAFPGFLILGLNVITLILITAVMALGIGDYLGAFLPGIAPVWLGVLCVFFATLCGLLHIRTNAWVTGLFLLAEVAVLLVLAALGFLHVERPLADVLFYPLNLGASGGLEPVTLGAIGLATVVANFAYNGYGNAVYLGEEMHEAPRHLGRLIILSLFIAVVAEAVPVTAMLLGAPDLKELFASHAMITDFIRARGGERLSTFVSLGIAFAIFNADIATIVLIGRQVYSTGRDQVWTPRINRALTQLHKRFHSPWLATLIPGMLACAACFIGLDRLLVVTGTSLVVVYVALCVSVIVGRRSGKTAHGLYRMPLYPLPPIAGLCALAYVIYANYLDTAIGRPSLVATGGMMLLAAAYYGLVLRRRGVWQPRMDAPDDDI